MPPTHFLLPNLPHGTTAFSFIQCPKDLHVRNMVHAEDIPFFTLVKSTSPMKGPEDDQEQKYQ